jgi:hypothetical protein
MGAFASTISVTDFSEAKAIYDAKIAEGLSDEELFAQIKAAIDAKHHAIPAAVVDVPVEEQTVPLTEIAVA